MQSHSSKILLFLLIIFFNTRPLPAQVGNFRLQTADSLFQAKQYTQSIELYRAILEQKQYSAAMLLKMAYVKEGLSQVGEALYYLNLYYLATKDKSALDKMEELSAKYNLEGYKNTDTDRTLSFYQEHHFTLSLTVAVLILFLMSLSVYLKRKKQQPIASVAAAALFIIALGIHINAGGEVAKAIVAQPNTYVMTGPSAGASVMSVIDAGHRVEIVGRQDVWLKILWDGEPAFVKAHNLLPVAL